MPSARERHRLVSTAREVLGNRKQLPNSKVAKGRPAAAGRGAVRDDRERERPVPARHDGEGLESVLPVADPHLHAALGHLECRRGDSRDGWPGHLRCL